MLTPPAIKMQWPLGVLPTYCFNLNSVMLRIEIFNSMMQTLRNEIVAFHGVYFAKEISVSDNGKPLLHISLIKLSDMSPEEIAVENALPGFGKVISAKEIKVTSGELSQNKIGGPSPVYPEQARLERMQGNVVMRVTIGRDGRVHLVRLLSSPDPRLSIAAMTAAQRWVYRPITSYGYPVSVQTDLTVVFMLSR